MNRLGLALLTLLCGSLAFAQAYNYRDYRMLNNAANPFPYWLNDTPAPGVTVSAVEDATNGAFQAWDDVPCASTAFQYEGRASMAGIASPEDPTDTFNVSTSFVTDGSDPAYQYVLGGGAAYGASVALTYGGTLYQCDIYLNDVPDPTSGARPLWTTVDPTPSDGLDVETFVAHEVGHCQGLDHTLGVDDIMRPDLSYGVELRTPSAADQGALCNAYPVDGSQGSPCPPATCDNGLACVTASRADGGTFPPICVQGCTPGNDTGQCPLPYSCQASPDAPGGYGCLPVDGNDTQVGKACAQNADCGSALAICEVGGTLPSGNTEWTDGYCVQDCQNNPCPAESACTTLADGSQLCLKTCTVGAGDCRNGYVCAQTNAAAVPICVPQCHADVDCGSGYQCRLSDGTCLAVQNPSAGIGSPCTQDAECGLGETCFLNGAATGVCTQNCATAAGACPDGTTCHPAGTNGELICLRDCVSGSCAAGEQCAQMSSGSGCLPGCTSNAQCPVGDVCSAGECVLPAPPDAGCTSCSVDAGTPPIKPAPDAGTGPSSDGAFGCSSTGGGPWALAPLLLALALITRKERSWRSR